MLKMGKAKKESDMGKGEPKVQRIIDEAEQGG